MNIFFFPPLTSPSLVLTLSESSYWAGRCSLEIPLSATAQEQVTATGHQSSSVHARNRFKQTQKGSARKTHKYFILKFFFIISLERWKKLKKKSTKHKENNPNKHWTRNYNVSVFPRVVFHREKCFMKLEAPFMAWFRKALWPLLLTANPSALPRYLSHYLCESF